MFHVIVIMTLVQSTCGCLKHPCAGNMWLSMVFCCPASISLVGCTATLQNMPKFSLNFKCLQFPQKYQSMQFLLTILKLGKMEDSDQRCIEFVPFPNTYWNTCNCEDHHNQSRECLDCFSYFFSFFFFFCYERHWGHQFLVIDILFMD